MLHVRHDLIHQTLQTLFSPFAKYTPMSNYLYRSKKTFKSFRKKKFKNQKEKKTKQKSVGFFF